MHPQTSLFDFLHRIDPPGRIPEQLSVHYFFYVQKSLQAILLSQYTTFSSFPHALFFFSFFFVFFFLFVFFSFFPHIFFSLFWALHVFLPRLSSSFLFIFFMFFFKLFLLIFCFLLLN